MNPLEITLIIIGIITIIISCLVVDRATNTPNKTSSDISSVINSITDENKKLISEKMETILFDISEEIVVRTDDTLDKLSNEKIMAVNDFSEQILEKIRKNHEEVVFLYSMLEDKEKELKAAVKEIDLSKKKLQSIMDLKSKGENELPLKIDKKNNVPINAQTDQLNKQTEALKKQINTEKNKSKAINTQTVSETLNKGVDSSVIPASASSLTTNSNQQILELYSQGKSVLEISKLLDLGQGEVKLVIDLFKGKK